MTAKVVKRLRLMLLMDIVVRIDFCGARGAVNWEDASKQVESASVIGNATTWGFRHNK
jgi:hypothetical protein